MRVPYAEGVANRIGPEPCADDREGVGEASVGGCIGQPLSRSPCRHHPRWEPYALIGPVRI